MGDDWNDAAIPCRFAIGLAGGALVADRGARVHVGIEPEQDREVQRIAFLSAGQVEGDRIAVEIGLQVDLAGEPAARATECLATLPPFAPAAETWARTTVVSNICTRCADDESAAR